MRANLIFLYFALPIFCFGQNQNMVDQVIIPIEIEDYYKNLSLINSLTTKSERSSLVQYLEDGDVKKAPSNKREFYVTSLLESVIGKELKIQPRMPNTFNDGNKVSSSIIYQIEKIHKIDDRISIAVKTIPLSADDISKVIVIYESENFKLDEGMKLLSSSSISATEIHHWIMINKIWYKKEVDVVLTN